MYFGIYLYYLEGNGIKIVEMMHKKLRKSVSDMYTYGGKLTYHYKLSFRQVYVATCNQANLILMTIFLHQSGLFVYLSLLFSTG